MVNAPSISRSCCGIQACIPVMCTLLLILWSLCAFGFRLIVAHEFPIRIHDFETSSVVDRVLRIDNEEQNVDLAIQEFCEQNNVQDMFCAQLYKTVTDRIEQQYIGNTVDRPVPVLPNSHLSRFSAATEAEASRLLGARILFDKQKIVTAETSVIQSIIGSWQGRQLPSRVVAIHSCTFNDSSPRILGDMLRQISSSSLIDGTSTDTVIVLNYGLAVSQAFKEEFPPYVRWFEVDAEVSYFEIPTLRILHELAKHLLNRDSDAHILYLHTKGASYTEVYPQIEDWRNMMLHFLVHRHHSCFHLLQSGEVDCVGVNYKSTPRRIFSGNFWWSLASHLARLPVLYYETSSKYEAETWLLHRTQARIFVMHSTNINHAVQQYPTSCYADAGAESGVTASRDLDLCGGPRTMREHRKYWQLFEMSEG